MVPQQPGTYTHPDMLGSGVQHGWADPETHLTRIDWAARRATAVIPFEVIAGRPALAADALVATTGEMASALLTPRVDPGTTDTLKEVNA